MKKYFIVSILTIAIQIVNAQSVRDTIISDFDIEYQNIFTNVRQKKVSTDKGDAVNVNNIGNNLMSLLIQMEEPTEYEKDISVATRQLISTKSDPYVLILVQRAIKENKNLNTRLHLKEKLLKEIGLQVNLLMEDQYPYYNYSTKQKQLVKFVSIRSGNDMFTMAGLIDLVFFGKNKYWKDGGTFFQRNDDRDYTGSLLIELGTDYLNTLRRRPLKTYQTLLYGFDVYTPYFKDAIKFPADTSFNKLDRPHASFQYFGWGKKGISRGDKYRWSTVIKFGKIGGNAGPKFQNALHQDISYSPRPRGWGAQIANGGRIGFSIEFSQEFFPKKFFTGTNLNDWKNMYASIITEEKIGTYMSTASMGFRLSNKNFRQCNQNFINHRIRQTVNTFADHLMYNILFLATFVKHNTMLEGYGLMSTREEDNDVLTPSSRYYLNKDQVRRINYLFNTTVSYTTRFGTVFYNWKSISPETKLGLIGINSPCSGQEMNIAKRWHHFAEIGFTFNHH